MASGNDGMGITPHQGPAPGPAKTMDLTGEPVGTVNIDPGDLTPGGPNAPNPQSAPAHASTPPPQQPDLAAEVAEWKKRAGEALAAIGTERTAREEQDRKHAAALQKMQMNFQIAQASQAQQAATPAPDALPDGINPDDHPTFAQMKAISVNVRAEAAAAAIQATWDVTQDEINAVFAANPALQNVPEPQRTQWVLQQAHQLRADLQPPSVSPAPVAQPQAPQAQSRPVATVPLVEGPTGAPAFETQDPTNEMAEAQAAYVQANAIPDKKERNAARKEAWTRILALQGMSHEELSKSSFTS